jgi:hypothetical protein
MQSNVEQLYMQRYEVMVYQVQLDTIFSFFPFPFIWNFFWLIYFCNLFTYIIPKKGDAHHITSPPEDGDGARRSMAVCTKYYIII